MARTTICDLPTELILLVVDYLDYPSSVAVSHTNQRLWSIVPIEPPTTAKQKLAFLCAIELWPKYDQFFSCNICLKLRPGTEFTDKQINGQKREKGNTETPRRFCVDCGCRTGRYQAGVVVTVNGRGEVLCIECRERSGEKLYCTYCRMCQHCLAKQYKLRLRLPSTISPIELEGPNCPRCKRERF